MKTNFLKSLTFNPFKLKTQISMKDAKLSAILGRDVEAGYVPTAQEMSIILAALPNPAPTTHENAAATPAVATTDAPAKPVAEAPESTSQEVDIQKTVTAAVTAAMTPISTQLTDLSNRLAVVEGSAGAEKTTTPKASGEGAPVKSWLNPENPINAQIAKDLGEC
jgi:hypothetical protein